MTPLLDQRSDSILRERARRLARPVVAESVGGRTPVVTFRLGSEVYGIDIQHLVEVIPATRPARIPCAASEIEGLIAVRGRVTPLLNLARLLGAPAREARKAGPALLLRLPKTRIALLVDDVLEVVLVSAAAQEENPNVATECTRFVSRAHDSPIWLMAIPVLLTHPVLQSLVDGDL